MTPGVLRAFDWTAISDIVCEKPQRFSVSSKGKISFSYMHAKNEEESFDLDMFQLTLYVKSQMVFYEIFDSFKNAGKGSMRPLPKTYP
jgi:hypothetical protein